MTTALLTYRDVADQLQVTTKTIYNLRVSGQLTATYIGRAVRFHPDDVGRFLDRARAGRADLMDGDDEHMAAIAGEIADAQAEGGADHE